MAINLRSTDKRISLSFENDFILKSNLGGTKSESPISHWKLNDNDSSTVVVDSKGLNNGTATRNTNLFTTESGKINRSLDFNGTSDTINTNLNPITESIIPSNVSISVWFYWDGTTNEKHIITNSWRFGIANIHVRLLLAEPSTIQSISIDEYLRVNDWNHVVATSDETEVKVYINGEYKVSSSGPHIGFSDTNFRIGSYGGASLFFDNKIDDVRIYDRELIVNEVENIYNGDSGTESDQVMKPIRYNIKGDTTRMVLRDTDTRIELEGG